MGALLQILLRGFPVPNHDSDTEAAEVEVETHFACACCGDVRVDENAHQNKEETYDDSGGVGRQP